MVAMRGSILQAVPFAAGVGSWVETSGCPKFMGVYAQFNPFNPGFTEYCILVFDMQSKNSLERSGKMILTLFF